MSQFSSIKKSLQKGQLIEDDEVHWLYKYATNEELRKLSSLVKTAYHPCNQATYLIMCIINYTNICVAKCNYCSFYRLPHQSGTYLLGIDDICKKIDALVKLGGELIAFNGGFNPKLKLDDYARLFESLAKRYPRLTFYNMTVAEFMFVCKLTKVSYQKGATLLKASGTNWITGGGAEILDEAFRKRHSPGKYSVNDYFEAQEAIISAEIGSTATMVIGFDETFTERLSHLKQLRQFQESIERKLVSFLCWTYKPWNNALGGEEISTQEYLRWLAISRIYLTNIKHIRTSVLTQNESALEGLLYGANDFDLPTEDEVTEKAGATISLEFEKILGHSQHLGIETVLRKPFQL